MTYKTVVGAAAAAGLAFAASAQILATAPVAPTAPVPNSATTVPAPVTTGSTSILGLSPTWPLAAPGPVAATGAKTSLATAAVVVPAAPLPPLDLSTLRLWNWGGKWVGSEWSNGNSPLPWKFNHISQPAKADTLLTLDAAGAPQLQGGGATPARTDGLWETEVTLPQLRDGLVVAPLWLYDPASRDEIDFELAGKRGLDVTMHVYVNGVHKQNSVRLMAGTDLSGQRKRFGIKVNQASGFVEMFVDGARVHRWDKAALGFFVARPLKPWIEMWAANPANTGFVQWVGKWTPQSAGQVLTMRVHGYGYTDPAGKFVS